MFFLPTCESACAPDTYFNTPQVFMIAILQMCWSRCTSSSILHFSRTSWHMRGVHMGRLVTNMIDWLEVLSIEISVNWSIRVPDLWKTTKMFAVQHLGIQFFLHMFVPPVFQVHTGPTHGPGGEAFLHTAGWHPVHCEHQQQPEVCSEGIPIWFPCCWSSSWALTLHNWMLTGWTTSMLI